MHDDSMPVVQPEKYQLLGTDCPSKHFVCGDFGPPIIGDPGGHDEAVASVLELDDRLLPVLETPGGTDLPNVGDLRHIATLEDECRFNPGKLRKIRHLAKSYGHWRPIRGDGNCYYRAVIYGALEAALATGDAGWLRRVVHTFEQVKYDMSVDQRSHERLLRHLRTWWNKADLEEWVSKDALVDQALIRACRRLVRLFLIEHADTTAPNGLTYTELVHALDSTYVDVEDFCVRVVDPMGRDAETLALDALPLQLGIGVRLWILDRREEVDLVSLDTPGPDGKVDVHVLFKPGHYDLLYARDASDAGTREGSVVPWSQQRDASSCRPEDDCSSLLVEMATLPQPQGSSASHQNSWHRANLPAHLAPCCMDMRQQVSILAAGTVTLPAPLIAPRPNLPLALPLALASSVQQSASLSRSEGLPSFAPRALSPATLPCRVPLSLSQVPAAPLRTAPLCKVQDGERVPLRCIAVCGMPPCTPAVGGLHFDRHRLNTNCTVEPTARPHAESGPRWSGVLGCSSGVLFSLSGFWQAAAAAR